MNTESKANTAFTSIMLRGGRVTKWKGQVASCAPQVGHLQNVSVAAMAAALAFGGAMAIPSDALAQNVTIVVDSGAPASIDAQNNGTGALIINASVPVEGNLFGIRGENGSTATNLFITATDDVQGGVDGIYAQNRGTGTTVITTTGNVVGLAGTYSASGIEVVNEASAGALAREDALTIDANNVTGANFGIFATNSGAGSTLVKASGGVTGTSTVGIKVTNNSLANNLVIEANGLVTGGDHGIFAQNYGTGSTSVTATSNVTGTGSYGIYATNGELANDLTIVAIGIVRGGKGGIEADNNGTGSTSITATGDVTGITADGIAANNGGLANDLTIVAKDTVAGDDYGINAGNAGRGSTSITTTGYVNGKAYDGIAAINFVDAKDLTIVANGKVTGGIHGLDADNFGTGSTSITTTGYVTGKTGDGIFANNGELANDLTIVAEGIVKGGDYGIEADNNGRGSTSITAESNVTGAYYDGINAFNGELATDLTIVANGIVTGNNDGIEVYNNGRGSTSIIAESNVTGTYYDGIGAINDELATDLTIVANGIVKGGKGGIDAVNKGTGSTSITTTGYVTGTDRDGINATNGELATDLTIVAIGNVTGGIYGIDVKNNGTGSTSITATGYVTGITADGIIANNGELANDLTIVTKDTVAGDNFGIIATNNGTGSTSITATGDVTGDTLDGINAFNGELANDLTIVTNGIVTGDDEGIDADNNGTGSTSITATGDVTGTDRDGIDVYNGGLANDLTIVANGIVTGGEGGIRAYNYGTGSTRVTTDGDVYGQGASGINVRTGATAKDIVVVANKVTGLIDGIYALIEGNGVIDVTIEGLVTGGEQGIDLLNRPTGVDLNASVDVSDTGLVTGAVNGINMVNSGSGATKLTSSGKVSGGTYGISVANTTTGTDVTVSGGDVTGGVNGLDVKNLGTGNTSVTGTGTVTGTTGNSIDVFNAATAGSMTIAANNVTGAVNGINAQNEGNGVIDVTVTGAVTGGLHGVNTTMGASTGDLTVSVNVAATGSVDGGVNGVNLVNNTGGSTALASTGKVSGNVNGIFALNGSAAVNLTVTSGDVTGGINGILAANTGTGATKVSGTGTIVGVANGVYALNGSIGGTDGGTDLTIDVNNVTGSVQGINAVNAGTGNTSVKAIGLVTGTAANGINARNEASAKDLTVSAATVEGGVVGILAVNNGTGNTSVTGTGTGTVTGATGNGIDVFNAATAGSMTIAANNVTGGVNGILAANFGNGATKVSGTGTIVGVANGVSALNGSTGGTDLTIDVNNVTGSVQGINAVNAGIGNTSVKAIGLVTGTAANGINARNEASAKDLTVSAATVEGGVVGILAVNNGTGNTSVTVLNAASGGSEDGVRVSNVAGTGAISITAQDVKGGVNAIAATNLATGATAITASGKVEGGTGVAILASNLAGTTATINITATADVEATSGNAILNDTGNSILNVANGATISGTIRLGNGSDTANFALASSAGFANITVLDGGDNLSAADGFVDRLNLNGAGTYELDSARLTNWEEINVNAGRVTFSNAAVTAGTLGINQGSTLNGSNNLLATANVNIATGGTLLAANANGNAAMRIVGNLTNGGLVDLSGASAKVGDTLNISGNFTGAGGQIRLDTVVNGDNSPTDFVLVTGNVGGTNQIAINNVGGVGGLTAGDGIKLVQVNGTSTADAFALADDLEVGGFRYDLFLGGVTDPNDQDWYLRTVGFSDIAATTLSLARLSDDISMTFLGTLHERVGEQEHLAKRGYQNGGVSGLWGRFIGKGFRERLASKDLGEVKSNGSITGMQLGLDLVRKINGNGSATFAGAYSGYADGSSSDTNIFQDVARRAGGSKSKGWLAGLYGTHYGATGWYANAAVQASFLDAAANAANGITLKTDARTLLGSLEMGKTLKLGGRMAFEPQFQVIYSNNKFDGAVDSAGTLNEVAIEDSIIGRAGFRLKTTKDEKYNADGGLFSGYLKANLWHSFLGTDVGLTSAGQAVGKLEPKKTWVDIGVGTTLTVAKQTEIFFDADVEFGIDQKTTAGTGKIGLRFNW